MLGARWRGVYSRAAALKVVACNGPSPKASGCDFPPKPERLRFEMQVAHIRFNQYANWVPSECQPNPLRATWL